MPDTIVAALLSGFIGVLVGGIITYLATSAIETQKWEQQKRDRLLQDRREALKRLAAFLDPIDRAITRAGGLASPFRPVFPEQDPRDWETKWPDLLSELARIDLPADLRFLLPPGLYAGARPIVLLMDDIRIRNIELSEELAAAIRRDPSNMEPDLSPQGDEYAERRRARIVKLQQALFEKLTNLEKMAESYKVQVQKEYEATYQ